MQSLKGAARKAHDAKKERDIKRGVDLARKRKAIVEMQSSHRIVKELNRLDVLKMRTDAMVHIAHSTLKIVLCAFPIVVTVALTFKVTLYVLNLF